MKLQIAFYCVSVYAALLTGAAAMVYFNIVQIQQIMQ